MASFDELYAQAKAARPDAPDDILRAAAEMQLAEDQQISSGDFLGAVPNEAAMRANMGDPGAGSSEPSWNETFTVKRFDPLAAAMEAMGATMPSKKPVKGTPLEAALAAIGEAPSAPATQNSLPVEVGRQVVAGYGDAAKMINQAGEWFAPSGSSMEEFFRQGKEYWDKYGSSGVTAPFVDKPGSAKEWEPQLEGRSLPGEILIKGARAFVPSVAGIGAATMNPLVGGAAIFSLFGGSQAQETWDKGIKLVQEGKLSEDDLLKASLINMVIEGGGETIADMLGAKFILNPLAATLKDVAKKDGLKAAIELAKNPAWVKDFAKGAIANAAVQSGTEYGQNYGETSVENAYGISTENPHEQGVEGFKGGLGLSTLLMPGGAVSSRRAGQNRQLAGDILSSPDATQEQKQSAAGYMLHELEQRGVKTTTEDILKATSVDGAINAANASLEATGSLEQSLDAFKNPATLGDQQALPNYAGPPLVVFSDGSTMTQAEAQQRNALGPMPAPATPDNSTLTAAAKTSNEANLAAVQSEEQGLRATSPVKTISGIPAAEHTDQSLADLIANPDTNHITRNAAIAEQNNRLASAAPTQEGTGGTNAITATLGGTTADVTPAPTPKTNTVAEAAKILSTPAEQRVPADQMKLRNVAQRIGDAAFAQLEQYVKGRALLTRDQRVSVEKLIASDGRIAPAAKAEVPTLPAPATQQALADNEDGQFSQQRVTELFGPGAQFREASSPDVRGERVGSVMRKFLTQMGRLTGTKVVFFNEPTRADGATREGNTVYINTSAKINPLQVLGHETTHILKKKHHDAWLAIKAAVEAGLGSNRSDALLKFAENYWSAPANKAKLDKLKSDAKLLDSDATEFGLVTKEKTVADFLMDEMIADMGGEQWSDPTFWDGVFKRIEAKHGSEKAKGIISRLVAAVKEAINKFLMLAKMPGFGTTEKLNLDPEHLKAIRSAIEAAYAEFISAERRNEPDGYAAERAKLETMRAAPKQERPVDETDLEGQQFPDVQETPKRAEFKDQTLPTRWPTAAGLTPSVDDSMITDLATLKQNEKQYAKAVAAILEEPGMHSKDIVTGTLDEKADHVIERLKTNLLWLFDQIPAAIRERSKLWYDGARRIAEVWAERYDISNSQAAGMLAVLSPQKDWFMNVTMAERVLDIIHTKMDHKFDERMDAAAFSMLTKDSLKDDPDARKNLNAYEAVKNKTLRQVAKHHNLREMSVWIRAYDEAYHDAKHAIVTPEGGFVEDKLTVKGEPTLRAWGDFTTPGKAASIYLDGTPENINKMLGGEHKVRNFYNNIYAPGDNRFVTIDTHAVAADMLRALAGADKPVAENFGKTGGTNLTGLSGTYALHYEAYQRAAQERGVLPREMQSITWEAVRGLFTEGFKGKKDNVADIDQIWRKVDAGELTADQARSEILERAGGITNPDWWQEGNAEYKAVLRDKTYNQERQPFRGARMVFEIAPDPRNRALKARWDNLSPEAQAEISHKVAWKIVAKALASFGDENMKGELHTQLGGWLDDTNPSLAIWFNKRAAASKIGDLVRIVGYALNQMGMMRTSPRPFKKPDGTKADRMGAIQIKLGKNLSRDEIHSIYADLRTAITGKRGKRLINGHSTADGVMIILNDGKLISDEALTQRIGDRLFGKYDVQLDEIYADFPAKGKDNYGLRSEAGKDSRLGAEPSLRARADQLRAESGLLLDQLIGERERGIQSSERRSDATGDRSDRAGVASEDRASYGRAVDRHSVSVTGVHYSQQERQELSSAFFGSGLKGQERLRISYADDPRIKRRLYFYANTGKGINPEAGVGSHAHSVDLNNVYDMDVDPLKLYQHSDNGQYRSVDQKMNDFESAVLDAGYDGYLTRDFGMGGAVVLLGDHSVPVKYEGVGARPDVESMPAPKYSDLQKLRQQIAENRSLPNGRMTGLEWKRTMLREMPEVDPRWLENDKLYYKDQLLSGADGAAISHSEARDLQSDHEVQNEIQGDRAIDPDRLKALRRDAARIERPMAGISLRITDDGRAIATGPKGARVPDTFRKFAAENGLRFMAQRKLPEPSDWTNDIGDQYSPAMPIEYRESGAMYFNEMGSAFLDRTDKTRFSEYRAVDTESAEFKKWFKGSAVVDAEGRPLVVYHGTQRAPEGIDKFGGGMQYQEYVGGAKGEEVYWFTSSGREASSYANWIGVNEEIVGNPTVYPVYLSIKNPAGLSDLDAITRDPPEMALYDPHVIAQLKSQGFDGFISSNEEMYLDYSDELDAKDKLIVAFSPTQIKSAITNTGEFSDTNPDIRYSTPRQQNWYYSALEDGLRTKVPAKIQTQPATQWKLWIRNNIQKLGTKAEEIEWSGILDHLDTLGKEKVTADQLAQWVAENGVLVEEVVLGDENQKRQKAKIAELKEQARALMWEGDKPTKDKARVAEAERLQEEAYRLDKEMLQGLSSAQLPKHASGNLVLPGGTDHREIVLTVPTIEPYNESDTTHYGDVGKGRQIAWARVNTRTDANGNKVLFVEEIQSQRNQHGRTKGFDTASARLPANPATYADIVVGDEIKGWGTVQAIRDGANGKEFDVGGLWITEDRFTLDKVASRDSGHLNAGKNKALVPTAPFVSTKDGKPVDSYISLVLKRLIAYAVDNGFDSMAWVTGDQTADRYDLSKVIEKIEYKKVGDKYWIRPFDKKSGSEMSANIPARLEAGQLDEYIGKELAQKVVDTATDEKRTLSGLDLKVGGGWTASMYGDSRGLDAKGKPSMISSAAKKLGAEVGEVGVNMDHDASQNTEIEWNEVTARNILRRGGEIYVTDSYGNETRIKNEKTLDVELEENGAPRGYILGDTQGTQHQPGFTITPAMRDQVQSKGMPLFSQMRAVDVESPEFKAWFGDSKVVDADGKPLVVYHGTIHDFSSFNAGQYSGLIFLTPSKEFANDFAARYQTALAKGEPFDPNVMPVYVSASNIFDFRNPRHVRELVSELKSRGIKFNAAGIGRGDWDALELSGRPKVMQELGFDGLYIKEHGLINIAVFSPTQIKSAVSNTGEFDSANPDIRFTEKRRSDVFTREERRLTKDLRSKAITEEQWMDGMRNAVRKFIDEVGANLGDRESAAEMFSRLGINENSKYGGYYELRKHILEWNTAIKMGPTYQNWAHMVHGFASADSTDATIRYIKHQPYAPTTMQSTRERLVAVAKTLGWVVKKPATPSPEVAGLLESTQRIVGDSGRPYDPAQKALFQRTGREVTEKSVLERLNTWVAKSWKQGLFDQFAPFRGTRAYILMRLSKGAAGALEAFMRHGKLFLRDGATDADTSGGVIKNVFVPLGKETTDFLYWIAGNRAERLAMEGKERLFTTADIAAAKSLANGTTDFDYTMSNGQVTRDRTLIYRDSLKKFNEYNKNIMDLAEASGLIDGQARHLWEHEFYVPFYRVMEDDTMRGMGIKKGIVRQEAFKKLKGGEEKMGDLLSNTLANWAHLIDASAKNRAAKAAVETAVQMGVARPAVTGEKETVWYMDGGKKQTYRISDKGVMEAIIGLEYAGMKNLVMDVLTKPKHWLTMGVTASPFFKVRNLIRDSIQAIATSDLSYNAIGNVYQGLKLTDRDRQEYVSALAGGGLIRLGTMLEGNEVARTRQLIKQGSKDSHILSGETALRKFYDKALEPALEWYNELGNRGEEINRMSLYDQMIKSGMDHAQASLMARDLMDFSLQGSFTTIRFLAQVVPFFNARVQGLYKLGRASQENSAHMAVVTFMATLAGLGLMALAARDDDEWKRWKNRPESDKQNYWYFTLGGKEYRIPRPFELGAVAFVGERTVEAMIDNERDAGKRLAKSILDTAKNQLSMNPTPQAVKPILDIYSNRDSFRDTPIESMSMQRLEPTHRYTGQTSMPARWMSEATAGYLSPVQYDHLVQSYFGWMGAMAVSTADEAYRAINNSEPKRAEKDLWKLATGGMVREDPVASRYVSQMYDQAKELEQAHATHNQLRKEGKVAEATEFRDENIDKLKAYRSVEAVKKQESLISERIRMIERSEIHPAEKRIKIRELRERQAEIAARLAQ